MAFSSHVSSIRRVRTARSASRIESLESRALFSGSLPGVPNVEAQFDALKHHGEAVGWFLPEDQGAPDPSLRDHYQGLTRYPGKGAPVFYITQLDDDDTPPPGGHEGGYLEVVRLNSRNADGERLRSNLQRVGSNTGDTSPPAGDTWLRAFRFDGVSAVFDGQAIAPYRHPGGMSIVDNVLFMALDQKNGPGPGGVGMVLMYDLGTNGEFRDNPQPLQALPLDHDIDNVAVTRMADGHYMLWTNGDGGEEVHVYHTTATDLRDNGLTITHVQEWNPSDPNHLASGSWPTGGGAHQSSTFVREFDGGDAVPPGNAPLYLIGLRGANVFQDDNADLYRVNASITGGVKLTHVRTLHMFTEYEGAGTIGNFVAASGAYVSPTGELMLYSAEHDDEDSPANDFVHMAEFRHRDVNREGSPLRQAAADAGASTYTVNEGATVQLNGTARPPTDRPWVELFDDDHGWAHKFENPDDEEGDRSIVVDYDDRDLFELNNFDHLDEFGDKTSSVSWRAPVGLDIVLFEDDTFGGQQVILKGTGQTERVENFDSQVVVPGLVESPGRSAGQQVNFGDDTSSMRWVGSPPPQGGLTTAWDLDGDGVFGETGAAAARGAEAGLNPTFSAAGLDGPGDYTVTLRATDADGNHVFDTATVHVNNVAPVLANLAATAVGEDGVTKLTGTVTDPGSPDTFTLDIDWGDPLSPGKVQQVTLPAGTTTFEVTHRYLDDNPTATPADAYAINVTLADDDGASDAGATSVTVSNVAPVIATAANSATAAAPAAEGQPVTFAGTFTDAGTLDTHTATIDWGDGTTTPATVDAATRSFSAQHAYANGGIYTAVATLVDDDGGSVQATTTALVVGVGVNNGQLQIVGPNTDAHIQVKLKGNTIEVMTSFDEPKKQVFSLPAVQSIRIVTGAGDDHIIVHKGFTIPVTIETGAGNDHVQPGDGPVTVLGLVDDALRREAQRR